MFGRAYLDSYGGVWTIPQIGQAMAYGSAPSYGLMKPSICQTFGYTSVQARATGSGAPWTDVSYTVISNSFGTHALVSDVLRINLDFRLVGGDYIWKSSYSCGYTCTP